MALEVQKWLHERVKSVLGKSGRMTPRTVRAVAERCGAVSVSKHFQHVDPRELVRILKSLIEKEVVKEFTMDGLPCFIPVSYCSVEVVSARAITQYDIDNG